MFFRRRHAQPVSGRKPSPGCWTPWETVSPRAQRSPWRPTPAPRSTASSAGYRQSGINRLSFGAQSFDDDRLVDLGRIHDSSAIRKSWELARAAGFDNLNLDLMYGLPNQNRDGALADLETAIALEPEHLFLVSAHPGAENRVRPPATTAAGRRHSGSHGEQAGCTACSKRPATSATKCPPSRGRAGACRHNLKYWTFGDYLGVGAGAHGKTQRCRTESALRTRKAHQPRLYLARPDGHHQRSSIPDEAVAGRVHDERAAPGGRCADRTVSRKLPGSTWTPSSPLEASRSKPGCWRPTGWRPREEATGCWTAWIQAYL